MVSVYRRNDGKILVDALPGSEMVNASGNRPLTEDWQEAQRKPPRTAASQRQQHAAGDRQEGQSNFNSGDMGGLFFGELFPSRRFALKKHTGPICERVSI